MTMHTIDIQYLFRNNNQAKKLRSAIQKYWVSFAETGDPKVAGLPTWPEQMLVNDVLMSLGGAAEGGLRVMEDVRAEACDWHESFLKDKGYPVPDRL